MKASLDTNVLIHLYRANQQNILFGLFTEGVFAYEQIRAIELEHHGQDILEAVDQDIESGKIKIYTVDMLRELGVNKIFENNVKENRLLYGAGDLGEVYAISLAQTLGAYFLVTDDTKIGGPYMSLLQFVDNDIKPFNVADLLILQYLSGYKNAAETVSAFEQINTTSELNWSFRSHLQKFIGRFWRDLYQVDEKRWMEEYCDKNHIKAKGKFEELKKHIL